jgi:hypothetical protein
MPQPPAEPRPVLAYVLLEAPEAPRAAAVLSGLKSMRDDGDAAAEEENDDQLVLRVGGDTIHVLALRQPFPWKDLEGPCATAWWWPDAADACRASRAHLIVAGSASSTDPFEPRLRLTQAVAAILRATRSLGVYWGDAATVQPAAAFIEGAAEASREYLPLYLWVDFRVEPLGKGSWLCATTGLEGLGFLEIEVTRSTKNPKDLIGIAFNAAHYLCDHGPVLEHGHTLGVSSEQRLRVTHEPSVWNRGTVLRLQ